MSEKTSNTTTAALIEASKVVDSLRFRGERLDPAQENAWPRRGVYRADGSEVIGVPDEVTQTAFYIAHNLLTGVPMSDDVRATIQRMLGAFLEPGGEVLDGPITSH